MATMLPMIASFLRVCGGSSLGLHNFTQVFGFSPRMRR
ncbi:Hypothetical protein Cul05146_1838 [Corynebacterium ulcerans]|nr:Hypothetical protein Cul05146_1838 [Corynebacterium ulcerans]